LKTSKDNKRRSSGPFRFLVPLASGLPADSEAGLRFAYGRTDGLILTKLKDGGAQERQGSQTIVGHTYLNELHCLVSAKWEAQKEAPSWLFAATVKRTKLAWGLERQYGNTLNN